MSDNTGQKHMRQKAKRQIYTFNGNKHAATPEITDEPRLGYLSQAAYLTKSVGYWQSLRLSIALLKLTPVSTMVKSPQLGAQKAPGSSYRTHDQ